MSGNKDKLLKKSTKKAPAEPGKRKDERPIIKVEDKTLSNTLDQFTAFSHSKKVVDGHEKAMRGIFLPFAQKQTYETWAKQGCKTESIKFVSQDGSSVLLQVKDTLKRFRIPKGEDGEPMDVKEYLSENKIDPQLIDILLENEEFEDRQAMTIPLEKLEKDNQALFNRLTDLIVAANEGGVKTKGGKTIKFTDDEMGQLIESVHDVTIKPDFLKRIVGYAKKVADDKESEDKVAEITKIITSVFAVLKPDCAFSSVTPGFNEEEILRRALSASTKDDNEEEEDTPAVPKTSEYAAGAFILRATGLEITVVRSQDKKEMCKRTCVDKGHLDNTIKKYQKDPNALAAFIAENT